MKTYSYYVLFLLVVFCGCSRPTELTSPDGNIKLVFNLNEAGAMTYGVSVGGKPFITPSVMGFEGRDGLNLSKDFQIENTEFTTKDETWTQPWGENKSIRNHYNEMAVRLKDPANTRLTLRFRVFDDGLGFRYEYQVPQVDSVFVMDELTSFNLAQDGKSWSIPASFETYELLYRTLPVSKVDNANTPMTFKTDNGVYASIHEAALTDFPEMTLKHTEGCHFKSELASWPDGVKARFAGGTFVTPWRSIQIAPKAVGLINSGLILNLNEPCALEGDLSWIRPMKYVGIWWGMHLGVETWTMDERHGATTANAKRYIDFAAANNLGGVLVEGWNEDWATWKFSFTKPYTDFDIQRITDYGRSKGVALIGHHETGGNVSNYENQMEDGFKFYEKYGVHQVKTGYVGDLLDGKEYHSSQFGVLHYRKVIEAAARHRICIDNHEPVIPTGLQRTFPNLMTQEGVRGQEWDAWDVDGGNPPSHTVILPFTRGLAGPIDFTPLTFRFVNDVMPQTRVHTTLAKQLALFVVLYSPLQMASDEIENYEANPEPFNFIVSCPTDWSRTVVPEACIGSYVTIARCDKGEGCWYIGSITGDEERTANISLSFLDTDKSYLATIYRDAPESDYETCPAAILIEEREVTYSDTLTIRQARSGGTAVRLCPIKDS